MSFWDLIRTKSQKTKDEDEDEEYFIKVLKIGFLQLEKSKVPRKAIIKLLAPLRLSEKKEILRKVDEAFQLPSRRDAMTAHYDWYYLANCQYLIEQEIKDRHENKMKRLNERRKSMIKLVRINNK